VKQIMRYELLDGTGVVAIGRKQNFCMADTRPYVANPPPAAHNCNTVQGLTHGWADLYDPDLDCQWLDVTGLPNGQYTLRLTVDPTNAYAEDNENNNVTTRLVVLQNPVGYEVDPIAQMPTMRIINARPEWGAEAIHFTTGKESGRVTLSVFDVRGAERRTLLDQEEEAGASEYVQWRGTDQSGNVLPSGIYYVRLKLPAGSMTRPVLILSRRN